MKAAWYITLFFVSFFGNKSFAQTVSDSSYPFSIDSVHNDPNNIIANKKTAAFLKKDSTRATLGHDPKKATLRSLILPGWGQAYNKRYWEIPIVYGALGITGAIYLYNNKWYKRTRDAYDIRVNRNNTADTALIFPRLVPLSTNSLQVYRNSFRRDRDYSALWFIIFWGLNVLDATVFGHLKAFDVSEDLSLRVNPVINLNGSKGLGLALGFKSGQQRFQHYRIP